LSLVLTSGCVDPSYSSSEDVGAFNIIQSHPTIVYQKPEKIKTLIQNYSCKNCGLFEISVRKNIKTQKGNGN